MWLLWSVYQNKVETLSILFVLLAESGMEFIMRKVLVTAGGTATAWHIVNVVEKFLKDDIEVVICDTNEPYLVPAAIKSKKAYKVPPVVDANYTSVISDIIKKESIDCIIPLIPQEAYMFAPDSEIISKLGIITTAPAIATSNLLTDKINLYTTLKSLSIPSPKVYSEKEVRPGTRYILKPRLGFGSQGITVIDGKDIRTIDEGIAIQEYCCSANYDEITVEVYNGSTGVHIFSRRRIATKAGVCVKMEPVDNELFLPTIIKIIKFIPCPKAFNVQFLRHNGEWKLFDCNLRLGAGTALSSAIGFQLTRALLAEVAGVKVQTDWFDIQKDVKAVLRVYQEVVVK